MTLVTEYAAIQKAKRLQVGIVTVRDETRRDPELHWHPVDQRPEEHCPGCDLARRIDNVLMEATR